MMALSACSSGDPLSVDGEHLSGGYPSLNSVASSPRPSSSIEERREIVRGLIDERDRSRRQTAVVRERSGLTTAFPLPSSDQALSAEDIIPDARGDDGEPFRLRSESKVRSDSVYRGKPQFEDGGLDDFIRQLKRNTTPKKRDDTDPASEDPDSAASDPDADEVSTLIDDPLGDDPFERDGEAGRPPILLAGFAPGLARPVILPEDTGLLLAQSEDEPGFFCGWLGWTVAWSNMCVSDAEASPDSEEGLGADVEQEAVDEFDSAGDETTAPADGSQTADEDRQERTERRLSEEEATDAIEDAGRSVIAPVTSSLDKLRDFIRARRAEGGASSTDQRSPSFRQETGRQERAGVDSMAARADRRQPTPLPRSRPERRDDIVIADRGETFTFHRTPTPAFKPSRDDPTLVILPPENRRMRQVVEPEPARSDPVEPPAVPKVRPQNLVPDEGLPSDQPIADLTTGEQEAADAARSPDPPQIASTEPKAQPERTTSTAPAEPPEPAPPSQALQDALAAEKKAESPATQAEPNTVSEVPASPSESEEAARALEEAKTPTSPSTAETLAAAPSTTVPPVPAPSATAPSTPTSSTDGKSVEGPLTGAPAAGVVATGDVPARTEPVVDNSLDVAIIEFGPDVLVLPPEEKPGLAALLEDAKTRGRTIYIIGEAATNHLAKRRATDVGAALVQLGATVEILEYDHEAIAGVDRVRLVLRAPGEDPLTSNTAPDVTER